MTSFPLDVDVSRETLDRLLHFETLLTKWTGRINLVSSRTTEEIWHRHIRDSAQIAVHLPPELERYADLGSGGGLPGIVLAVILSGKINPPDMTFVESDQRKATFLRTAVRELGISATVISQRIENVPDLEASVVTARALAPLSPLFDLIAPHIAPNGTALLPKGRNHETEIAEARMSWSFDVVRHISTTDPESRILEVRNIARAAP